MVVLCWQVTMYLTDAEAYALRSDLTLYPDLTAPRVTIHVVYKRQVLVGFWTMAKTLHNKTVYCTLFDLVHLINTCAVC